MMTENNVICSYSVCFGCGSFYPVLIDSCTLCKSTNLMKVTEYDPL